MKIYLKNMAGGIITVFHNFSEETEWDLKNKIKNILDIDDVWRVCLLDMKDIDGDRIINYIILDSVNIDIKVKYIDRYLDISSNCYYWNYRVYVSYDDNNYDYDVYYDNKEEIFYRQENVYRYSFNDNNSIIVDIEEEIYKDLKSLILDNKFFPIIYREKIANIANDKWILLYHS